jgi:hypothetical protein
VRAVVAPTQTAGVPRIGVLVFTVTTVVALQPVAVTTYVIVLVPPATPVTTPEVDPTVALVTRLLAHVPVPVASLKDNVEPAHTGPELPSIGVISLTVILKEREQPVASV